MKVEIRTLALTKKLAKSLPHKAFRNEHIPHIVGYVRPEAIGYSAYCCKYALVQLEDKAFWAQVTYNVPDEWDEITLY